MNNETQLSPTPGASSLLVQSIWRSTYCK